mgnify:FL=1
MTDPLFWHRLQFGTNRTAFSRRTGDVIGQTLATGGTFAFFLESSFLVMREVSQGPRALTRSSPEPPARQPGRGN